MKDFKFTEEERATIANEMVAYEQDPSMMQGVVIDRIESLIQARADADGWVKVEDGLPEIGQRVIAYNNTRDMYMCVKCVTFNKESISYKDGHRDSWLEYITHNNLAMPFRATHWHPLPSPPKQKQNDHR